MSRKMMWTMVIAAVVVAALIAMVFVSGRKSAAPPEEQKGTELVEMVPEKGETEQNLWPRKYRQRKRQEWILQISMNFCW